MRSQTLVHDVDIAAAVAEMAQLLSLVEPTTVNLLKTTYSTQSEEGE